MGPCYGVLAGLHALAGELGLVAALGPDRVAKLALFLIYARVARQGSRLGAVRWAEDHAVAEVLGLEKFDEDDLSAALDWLQIHQERIERALAPKLEPGAVFLYDVTSSYFEGQCNELGEYGYNRDGKRYKKQVVAGLLTEASGEPLSIQLYPGNTSDPKTFLPTVGKLRLRFPPRPASSAPLTPYVSHPNVRRGLGRVSQLPDRRARDRRGCLFKGRAQG
jgi:hypothetical protein